MLSGTRTLEPQGISALTKNSCKNLKMLQIENASTWETL